MRKVIVAGLALVVLLGISERGTAAKVPAATTASETTGHLVASVDQDKNSDQLQMFNGTIVSMNGELFILRDDTNQVWFHLDDQREAEKFAGKKVVVTGVLDPATDVIHVKSINEQKS